MYIKNKGHPNRLFAIDALLLEVPSRFELLLTVLQTAT